MSRPFVSIVLAAALALGVSTHAQAPDSAAVAGTDSLAPPTSVSKPETPASTDSASGLPEAPIPSPDAAAPTPVADEANVPRDKMGRPVRTGPAGLVRPEHRRPQIPPPTETVAPAGEPTTATEPIAPPAAVIANLPFDEDSALEIKLKTDPEAARRYRSPRKAFFFSLLLPGAGQAYCGSWAKMTAFAAAEIGLGVGWYQVAVVASRDKANEAKRYARENWSQGKYESNWKRVFTQDTSANLRLAAAPGREEYCRSLYGDGEDASETRQACVDAPTGPNYSQHDRLFGTINRAPVDSVFQNIVDPDGFYDMVGRYSEFATGWRDVPDTASVDGLRNYAAARDANRLDPTKPIPTSAWGISQMQANYRALRRRSDDLARTQKWFLGGMVLNHLVSALDAALQATRMNRTLLHLETTSWVDRLEIDGGFVMVPQLKSTATLAWRF